MIRSATVPLRGKSPIPTRKRRRPVLTARGHSPVPIPSITRRPAAATKTATTATATTATATTATAQRQRRQRRAATATATTATAATATATTATATTATATATGNGDEPGHGDNGHGDDGPATDGNPATAGATTRTTARPVGRGGPWPVGQPPGPGGGGGGGGGHPEVPSGHPRIPPRMQLPPELMPPATEPVGPSVIDVAPGVGVAAAEFPIPPITLPVIVAPATGLGGGGGSPGSPALPAVPRGVTAKPPAGREPLPANVGSNVAVPASSYRIGYTDYLRYAGLSQVAALAVPGVAGMLVLTGAGGLVGYRQAKAGHAVHTSGTARFVN